MVAKLNNIEEFMDWLEKGSGTQCKLPVRNWTYHIIRVYKNEHIDYLFVQEVYGKDDEITKNYKLEYAGFFCKTSGKLCAADYHLQDMIENSGCPVLPDWGVLAKEMCNSVREKVEELIDGDRNNLKISSISNDDLLKSLIYAKDRETENTAREAFLSDKPVGVYKCKQYTVDLDDENVILSYVVSTEAFVEQEARKYIENNQEQILYEFLLQDLIKEEYDAILNNPSNSAHTVKQIIHAVSSSGAKTVNVTIRRGDAEGTFKFGADLLARDCGSSGYNTWSLTKSERERFEELFGTHKSYFQPQEIVRITYGRRVLFESGLETAIQ